jgi:MYXO-CTERM domain-containing protein
VPDEAWPEDSVRLLLTGTYLVLVDGEVSVDLGAGVEVVGVEVRDVDTAWIDLYVDPSAAAGPRTLTLQSGPVTLEVPDAFDVLDGGGRPRLDAVDPEFVRQGVETELVFTIVGGLEGLPTVDLGEGVIVESVWVEGDTVHVLCAVANDAALGERVPTIDDGVRVLDGVRFEVKDGVAPAADVCGPPAAPSGWLGLGGLVLLVRRRREASRRR